MDDGRTADRLCGVIRRGNRRTAPLTRRGFFMRGGVEWQAGEANMASTKGLSMQLEFSPMPPQIGDLLRAMQVIGGLMLGTMAILIWHQWRALSHNREVLVDGRISRDISKAKFETRIQSNRESQRLQAETNRLMIELIEAVRALEGYPQVKPPDSVPDNPA